MLVKNSLLLSILAALMVAGCQSENNKDTSESKLALDSISVDEPPALRHVPSPHWQDQIIYFLMTDRFNDGDPSNNDMGQGEYDPSKESHYNGGDIIGITQQLDYIQQLGATAVWITPPVANQWWSSASEYSGYHGYWARDFKKVDEHYGTLQDYQQLSESLHSRGMYLIQDIVLNHSGIYFGYEGQYNPENTDENFKLFEQGSQAAPEQSPFDMVNRLNPEHAAANIYNWTPGTSNYQSEAQQFTYQLGNLSDINTKNPAVIAAFKDTYRYWMQEVGVDAFRIDTVKYVEHRFWQQFLHDNDGIYAKANELGKAHFLTFGEVFDASKPFETHGEEKVIKFLGTPEKPELNSVIGFPLYFEVGSVLGEGKPTAQLAFRLQKFMEMYPDPYVIPNFIDNHDTKRFLAGANEAALQQALALLFTIPGIPVIYQGTEQGHQETRQAMFAGGYLSDQDQFNRDAELYVFIQQLAELRKSDLLFSRGNLTMLASNQSGPGLLVYQRQYQGKTALVVLNTAEHGVLLNNIKTGFSANTPLQSLYQNFDSAIPNIDARQRLSMELPARAIAIFSGTDNSTEDSVEDAAEPQPLDVWLRFDTEIAEEVFTQDIPLSGVFSEANAELKLVLNGNLDAARSVITDAQGNWDSIIEVRDLGITELDLQLYSPDYNYVSDKQRFTASVSTPQISVKLMDLKDDDKGESGTYSAPLQEASGQQMDVLAVTAEAAGANLKLTLKMQQVSDFWAPANGFDNTSFSLFFDFPDSKGARALPLLNSSMAAGRDWDLAHIAYGWGNYMYRAVNSSEREMGEKVGIAPQISVDKHASEITFFYRGGQFGVSDWNDVFVYLTTWDISGEGAYRELTPAGGEWQFGGAEHNAPKVMDSVQLQLSTGEQ